MYAPTKSPRKPTATTRRPTTKRVDKTPTQPPRNTKYPKTTTQPPGKTRYPKTLTPPPRSTKSSKISTPPSRSTSSSRASTPSSQSTKSPKDKERKPHQKDAVDDQKSKKSTRQRSKAKGTFPVSKAIDYKLDEVLPDMKLLLKKKADWNFRDPDYIRAAFVESETGMMEKWKSENTKFRSAKSTDIQFRSNLSNDLKMRHLLRKIEKERKERRHLRRILRNFENPPIFPPVQIFTNSTAQLRQSYIRNNPAVPAFVIQHYARFKKPPFKTTKRQPHKVTWCG